MKLVLSNGDVYEGEAASSGTACGELVFTTGYTGYEECLTDPSYNNQALLFCYPHIGNYGVDERRFESNSVHPSLVVAREFDDCVAEWLQDEGIPAIHHLDTRALTLTVRKQGTMLCGIGETRLDAERALEDPPRQKYNPPLEAREPALSDDDVNILLLDCGVKTSMEVKLREIGQVHRVPHNQENLSPEGVDLLFVSNGPGDPRDYRTTINTIRRFSGAETRLAGICLGHQLVSLALGGSVRKMEFGHRGTNQPVIDEGGSVRMTTQNHGWVVDEVPGPLEVTQRNINDDTIEGLEGDDVLLRQFHPEGAPGPHDDYTFFDEVYE